MNSPLFDMSLYQSATTRSYSPDWRDATESDPAWDEPELHSDEEDITAEPDGRAEDNSTREPTMAENETTDSSHPKVEVVEELSPEEEADRQRLELKVERAFYDAALALKELHDRKLHRSTHSRFDHYCRDRFGFSQQNADLLIRAAKVIDNLRVTTNGCNFLPTSERQVRPITKLEPDEQRFVWEEAVKAAGGKLPSGRIVKGIVERLKEKQLSPATDFYNVGDIFTLKGLSAVERKYNGCWAIAIVVNEFTLEVEVYDTVLTVKPDDLNRIDSSDERRQLPVILKRIKCLRQCRLLDRSAYVILESLGKQTYLTDLEEKLLDLLEKYYGIVQSDSLDKALTDRCETNCSHS